MQKERKFSQECADELGISSEENHKYKHYINNFVDEPKAQVNQFSYEHQFDA